MPDSFWSSQDRSPNTLRLGLVGLAASIAAGVVIVKRLSSRSSADDKRGKLAKEGLWVHYSPDEGTVSEESRALLMKSVHPAITITWGPDVPEGAHVFIGQTPKPHMLQASTKMASVIVPFAGIWGGTLSMLRESFPHLTVHNLHHNAPSTAEIAIALLLAAAKLIVPSDRRVRQGDWSVWPIIRDTGVARRLERQVILDGKVAVVVGLGEVGTRVALACLGMGMKVVSTRRTITSKSVLPNGIEVYPAKALHDLLPHAAALIVATPSTPETKGLIGEKELDLLGPEAVVVNVGRGDVIQEEALYHALKNNKIFAAGLDVWWQYRSKEHPHTSPSRFDFESLDNVVISPHRGGAPGEQDTELRRSLALAKLLNDVVESGSLSQLGNRVPNDRWY